MVVRAVIQDLEKDRRGGYRTIGRPPETIYPVNGFLIYIQAD